jgi:hypothetical protein
MHDDTRDLGVQPLDALMERWKLTNHDLVESSTEQITHKQIQRARKGRRLTLHLMQKVTRTLNTAVHDRLPKDQRAGFQPYLHKHLFDYAKGHDPAWQDPNAALVPHA